MHGYRRKGSTELDSPIICELVKKIKETPTLAQSEILTYGGDRDSKTPESMSKGGLVG